MTWVLDLGVGTRTKAIARAICRARADMRLVTAPQPELTGVIVCSASSSALEQTLVAAASANAHVIVVSEADHRLEAWSLLAHGATDLMIWHDDPRPIMARLARLVEVENVVESAPVADMIRGTSPALRRALRDLVTAARFGTGPILITGETGTGKELAARVAHAVSAAGRSGHLVVVDCTTIVPNLSGSELFGHERGAFTGAVSVRTGACAAANGGTLMLDEVGELPLELQPELLRVVQEGMYKRVGADTWQRTRFRLICATNRVLEDDVTAGRFRADLYYRIAAYVVRLPPLRDRPGDLIPLFRSFLSEAQGDAEPAEVTPEVEAALRRRTYPGNLRDLRQLAHRVASRHVGPGPVTPGDLPPDDRPLLPADGTTDDSAPTLMDAIRHELRQGRTLREVRDLVADLAVTAAVEDSGGSIRAAAQRLGVTDRALQLRRAKGRTTADDS
ncbi:sigma 54-interacting transcriptional regulator [Kribbella sp. NPDC005582]|uniref:sigma-54-dependent transcriptional regulator n=1 Tax=Kribbella sp. NPDC005582 TaxID=3156893 RepID=UPI0033B7F032